MAIGKGMRIFPIQQRLIRSKLYGGKMEKAGPSGIPWDMIAPHEEQARKNHSGQSLERLAEREGLCACEACAVLEDRPWKRLDDHSEAEIELQRKIDEWTGVPGFGPGMVMFQKPV